MTLKLDFTKPHPKADLVIKCTDGDLYFSQYALSSVDYFARMFAAGMKESQTGVIKVQVSRSVMTCALYAIFGQTKMPAADETTAVIDLAEQYNIPKLKIVGCQALDKWWDVINIIALRQTIDKYDLSTRKLCGDATQVDRILALPGVAIDHRWICCSDVANLIKVTKKLMSKTDEDAWHDLATQVVYHIDYILATSDVYIPSHTMPDLSIILERLADHASAPDARVARLLYLWMYWKNSVAIVAGAGYYYAPASDLMVEQRCILCPDSQSKQTDNLVVALVLRALPYAVKGGVQKVPIS